MGDEHGFDGVEVNPVFEQDRADGVDDYNDGREDVRGSFDEVVAVVPGVEVGGGAVAWVVFDGDVVLAGVSVDEDEGDVGSIGFEAGREGVGDVEFCGGRQVGDGLLGSNEIWETRCAAAPAHGEDAVVTALVSARVEPVGVGAGVGAEDFEGVAGCEGEGIILVLEKGDGVASNGMGGDVVVALDVDILVDHAAGGEESAGIKRASLVEGVAREVGQGIVLVLTHFIPGRNDAGDLEV